jgi:uncharacterized protein DUF1918
MEAHIGDRLVIDGEKVGQARRTGKVMGIQGNVAEGAKKRWASPRDV